MSKLLSVTHLHKLCHNVTLVRQLVAFVLIIQPFRWLTLESLFLSPIYPTILIIRETMAIEEIIVILLKVFLWWHPLVVAPEMPLELLVHGLHLKVFSHITLGPHGIIPAFDIRV